MLSKNQSQKNKLCPIRISEEENTLLSIKAILLNKSKSELFRDGAFAHWGELTLDDYANRLLKLYESGNNENKKNIVDIVFKFLKQNGYPHRKLSKNNLINGMRKIANTKNPLLDDDNLQVNTTGLEIANYFHPHMMNVKCLQKYKSPYELFEDEASLKDAINRWMQIGSKPNFSGLRRILRTRDGTRSVVNFKPAIAKFLYDNYAPRNGKILDPCSGYSGRLAACISVNKNLHYKGIDPDGLTATGNMKMASFYSSLYDAIGTREWDFDFSFELGCAEDIMPKINDQFDLIFTSPPYFNVEKYSDLPNQSWLRYQTYESWRDNFLYKILSESFRLLKDDGSLIWNIKNYKKMKLADDSCEICLKLGFRLEKTYNMRLSNSEYHRKDGKSNWHTEPIFVFKK